MAEYIVRNRRTDHEDRIDAETEAQAVAIMARRELKLRGVRAERVTGMPGKSGVFAVYIRRADGTGLTRVGPDQGYHVS